MGDWREEVFYSISAPREVRGEPQTDSLIDLVSGVSKRPDQRRFKSATMSARHETYRGGYGLITSPNRRLIFFLIEPVPGISFLRRINSTTGRRLISRPRASNGRAAISLSQFAGFAGSRPVLSAGAPKSKTFFRVRREPPSPKLREISLFISCHLRSAAFSSVRVSCPTLLPQAVVIVPLDRSFRTAGPPSDAQCHLLFLHHSER